MDALLDALIDGELTEEQRRAMDEHAAKCPECAEKARAAAQLKAMLGEALPEVDVPLETQAKWRRAVRAEAARQKKNRWMRAVSGVAAAMVLIAGVGFALNNRLHVPDAVSTSGSATVQAAPDAQNDLIGIVGADPTQAKAPEAAMNDALPEAAPLEETFAEDSDDAGAQEAALKDAMPEAEPLDEVFAEDIDDSAAKDAVLNDAMPEAEPLDEAFDEAFMEDFEEAEVEDDEAYGELEAAKAPLDMAPPLYSGTSGARVESDGVTFEDESSDAQKVESFAIESMLAAASDEERFSGESQPMREWHLCVADLDAACASVRDLLDEYEGSVEEQRFENGANLYVLLPAEFLGDFVSAAAHLDVSGAPEAAPEAEDGDFASLLLVLSVNE